MTTPGTRHARAPHRPPVRRRPLTAGVAVVLLGVLGACSSADDGTPTAESSSSPTPTRSASTPSATPRPSPTTATAPTPSTAPEPAAPAPGASAAPPAAGGTGGTGGDTGAPTGVPLRSGGRVGDLPAEAPEDQAVPYLTQLLGVEPVVEDPSSACGYDVGRRVRWGDLTVFFRSVDDLGSPVDPYMAAWAVDEPSSPLATVEGLRVGEPESRIAELYPGAVSGEDEHSHGYLWWNVLASDGGSYAFVSDGGTVTRISSGAVCGD